MRAAGRGRQSAKGSGAQRVNSWRAEKISAGERAGWEQREEGERGRSIVESEEEAMGERHPPLSTLRDTRVGVGKGLQMLESTLPAAVERFYGGAHLHV